LAFKDKSRKLKGRLDIEMKHVETGETKKVSFDNLVLNGFREQEVHLCVGDGATQPNGRFIRYFGLGTGTPAGSPLPVPAVTDTALTDPPSGAVRLEIQNLQLGYSVGAWSYGTLSVSCYAVLAAGASNGITFTECGLLSDDGTLCTRVVFPAMTKSALWVWTLRWTIQWT
jgi:hypothetical protein